MNIDRDDEYATRYEAAPTIEEQIAFQRKTFAYTGRPEDQSILASLEKLAALESQPVPVEPDDVSELCKWILHYYGWQPVNLSEQEKQLYKLANHIDSLQSALQRAQQDKDRLYKLNVDCEALIIRQREERKKQVERAEKAESINRRMVEQYRDLVVAAKKAQEAMMVWTNTYAPEMCDPEGVKKSQELLNEGGTLYYIATVSQSLSEALAKLENHGDQG